jgi:hypothetical protein
MSHPTKAQRLLRDAREGRPVQRVEISRVTCERCEREVYADAVGGPRGHLRPTRPGEPTHSEIVPTMTSCE